MTKKITQSFNRCFVWVHRGHVTHKNEIALSSADDKEIVYKKGHVSTAIKIKCGYRSGYVRIAHQHGSFFCLGFIE